MARWLLQLRLAQKFLILGLVALVMVAVPTTLYVLDVVGELRHTEQQAQGMPPLMAVNRAVQHLQVHRGTSAGMLGGNETMASRRPAVRDAVQQAMGEAQSALQAAHAPAALLQRLQGMNQRWVELEQAVASRSVQAPQSMQRHTQLVMAMLELGEAVRDTYGLMLVPEADDQALVQALLVQAPLLSENLGLLRGQGAGFLAQGNLPPENRGSLRALQRRVAELQGDMARPLERAMQLNSNFRSHLGPAYETLRSHTDASLQMASTQLVDAETLTLASPVFFDTLTRAIESINALSNQGAEVLAEHMNGTVTAYRNQMLWVLGLLALALMAAIWLAMVFVRSITQPLSRAVALAQSVAQGDLSGEDEVPARNEVGDLVAAQQQMRAKLRPMVAQVRRGADSVALASAEIAQGNMDLSGRTEQQASALEQTAASMEELSTTVRHNADNARTASELAESAREVAEQGGDVVARVVETMQGINEGSRRIADIIGVIDGIAFQTNILALNAAVEAARAGEQGRGFAVVASEVRSLAQRSADAAKEIKQLIESSVARVGEGNVLANQAGQTMGEVVAAIQKVSSIVAAISDASQQQADGVRQVGEAVTEMDQTTQQNAALVEEMASAANSLSVQGRQLVEAVAVFRWNGEATAPAAVAVRTEALPVHVPTPAVRATKAQQAALAEH